MIELPEALTLSRQLREHAVGKEVIKVRPPSSEHKFCWFNGDAADYDKMLRGRSLLGAKGFGIFVEAEFDKGIRLCFNDGVNVRLMSPDEERPAKYQLMVDFKDGYSLIFTVAMYGGIICHDGVYGNEYYLKSRDRLSPMSDRFDESYFSTLSAEVKPSTSAKAFLATEQRIPGIGNGTLQDILFKANINPRRKVKSLSQAEQQVLLSSVKSVLQQMTDGGGRDTEKDLLGNLGGYKTIMSKNTLSGGCPVCGAAIIKEAYLGGSVYYCPVCQPRDDKK